MSNQFLKMNAKGRGNVNPITQAGRIVYNVFKDDNEIKCRKKNSLKYRATDPKKHDPYYPGPIDDEHLSVLEYDLVYTIIENNISTVSHPNAEPSTLCLSTFNGAFSNGDSHEEVRDKVRFVGVALTGCTHDSTNQNPENNFPVQIGGITTILNNGNQRIPNGSLVIWDIPPPNHPFSREKNGSTRVCLIVLPYDVRYDSLSCPDLLREIMMKKGGYSSDTSSSDPSSVVTKKNADQLLDPLLTMFALSLHAAAMMGLVTLEEGLFEREDIRANRSQTYAASGGKYMEKLFSALGLAGNKRDVTTLVSSLKRNSAVSAASGIGARSTLLEHCVIDSFLAQDEFLVVPFGANGQIPPGHKGQMLKKQKSSWRMLYKSIEQCHKSLRSRVIGKAQSEAGPGDYFDIKLMTN